MKLNEHLVTCGCLLRLITHWERTDRRTETLPVLSVVALQLHSSSQGVGGESEEVTRMRLFPRVSRSLAELLSWTSHQSTCRVSGRTEGDVNDVLGTPVG